MISLIVMVMMRQSLLNDQIVFLLAQVPVHICSDLIHFTDECIKFHINVTLMCLFYCSSLREFLPEVFILLRKNLFFFKQFLKS